MSFARAKIDNVRVRGFTLIEITLAVAILAMMSLAIYRFVQTNVLALRVVSDATKQDARYDALRDLLMAQWQTLPAGSASFGGEALKLNDRPRDEVHWVCGAGPGLLTRYAGGDYKVTMRLKPQQKGGGFDLGFARVKQGENSVTLEGGDFIPLLSDVASMQIRYFDPRLNTWLDKWSDTVTLPRLVKITIGRAGTSVPWVAIIPLGRTPL